ncbi:MAG: hypothetical protein JWP02_1584 [Acidimicrobiales bacterium]|nr:hypothetical protein [Acidimicrobiales bacterium]
MSEDHLEREVLGKVGMDRRNFIKKVIVGTAFAAPVLASFDMLAMGTASGVPACTTPNGTASGGGTSGSGLQGGAGGVSGTSGGTGAAGGDPNGGCGGSGGTSPAVTPVARPRRRRF